jgi:Ferritin-like
MSGELRKVDAEDRQLLVDLLHEAAELEHCLLNTYLFAACSVKTLPREFAEAGNGQENRRRALQFERVRNWKQALLQVAREEMLHLHFVQCMLRALGERPHFALPDRTPDGSWIIPIRRLQVGAAADDGEKIPVAPLDLPAVERFVRYESTDSLQDDPFSPEATSVFNRLRDFELDYHLESALLNCSDKQRTALRPKLKRIYKNMRRPAGVTGDTDVKSAAEVPPKRGGFQSIADLYLCEILPRYQEAFRKGWVVNNDRDLNNELQNPEYGPEGLLPIGPVYRDKNFAADHSADAVDPMRRFKNVRDIIQEIVSEGEGATDFLKRADAMLDKVSKRGGARRYLEAVLKSSSSPDTPHGLAEYQRLRLSHLYRFAVMWAEYTKEQELARLAGYEFKPARTPVNVSAHVALRTLSDELPGQLNAAYLVLVSWLSRIYETKDWHRDERRRYAIEMLASWPLMSIAIRPLLELVSFFPDGRSLLFRLDATGLTAGPELAYELLGLYQSDIRSQEVRDRMDQLAVRVLSGVAEWANAQIATVEQAKLPEPAKTLIMARLRQAAQLTELERQFPYRVAGGYSDRMPEVAYQQAQDDPGCFEENPFTQDEIFDGFVLRFRFAGWGRVQLATDPDPPVDEAGCTGTHMLHASDGDLVFDRALVWQPFEPAETFNREPVGQLPELGVKGLDVSLLIASDQVTAGYMPLPVAQPTSAVPTSGGPQTHCTVTGLNAVVPQCADARDLRFDLLAKDGIRPFLNGMNHIISQDGEPIDPFILNVSTVSPGAPDMKPRTLFQREVYNKGKTILEMEPLQRLESSRQPCGFDSVGNIPGWAAAAAALSAEEQALMADPAFPRSYLTRRCQDLTDSLDQAVRDETRSRANVDQIVSYTERLALLGNPPRPSPTSDPPRLSTTERWLTYLLHYGHTLSGKQPPETGDNPVLDEIAEKTRGLRLRPATVADRSKPNARWLVTYAKGMMDTDALSDFIFGELYVPLEVSAPLDQPLQFCYRWSLPSADITAVREYACRFTAPFWRHYQSAADQRSYQSSGGSVITEVRISADENGYKYRVEGYPASDYLCVFSVSMDTEKNVQLEWAFSFSCDDPGHVRSVVAAAAADAALMLTALTSRFSPR